jgi:hypothetical protein
MKGLAMTTFVRTMNGLRIPLHQVIEIASTQNMEERILTTANGQRHSVSSQEINITVVNVVPAEGWEFLGIVVDDRGRPEEVCPKPIVAWGLTLSGAWIPMTWYPMSEENLACIVIRKAGSPTLYQLIGGFYDDENSWLAELQQQWDDLHDGAVT